MMRDVHMCRLIEMMTDWASSYSADDDETGSQSAEKGMGCPPQNVYPGPICQAADVSGAGGGKNVPGRGSGVRPIHSHSSGR